MPKTKKVIDRHTLSNGQGQGMNWIRKEKRLAIYLRDGLACCYCGDGVDGGAKLTLDHIVPHHHGGDNHPLNLITACHSCNSARGKKRIREFATKAALRRIESARWSELDVNGAKEMIERRGGFMAALQQPRN